MSRLARTLLISALTLSSFAGLALAQDKDTVGKPAGEAAQPKAEKKKLGVGDAPPALQVSKWVKGAPVAGFEKGKIYVVEFWATWCPPCKKSIPELTAMAKKHKDKVTMIGVSVWEREDTTVAMIEEFVKKMGDKMDYHVALDDGKKMAETWMTAAGQQGIPASFIVGTEGKIVWIGNPLVGLDRVLDEVVAGKFDAAAEAGKAKQEAEDRVKSAGKMKDLNAKMRAAVEKEDWKACVATLDEMAALNKGMAKQYIPNKFEFMSKYDKPGAYAFIKGAAANELKTEAELLNTIAWKLVESDDTDKDGYAAALDLSRQSNEASKNENGMFLDTLAYCYYRTGDVTKAIEIQEKALKESAKMAEFDDDMKKEMQDRLELFKKGKA